MGEVEWGSGEGGGLGFITSRFPDVPARSLLPLTSSSGSAHSDTSCIREPHRTRPMRGQSCACGPVDLTGVREARRPAVKRGITTAPRHGTSGPRVSRLTPVLSDQRAHRERLRYEARGSPPQPPRTLPSYTAGSNQASRALACHSRDRPRHFPPISSYLRSPRAARHRDGTGISNHVLSDLQRKGVIINRARTEFVMRSPDCASPGSCPRRASAESLSTQVGWV